MLRTTVSGIALLLLMFSIFALTHEIQPVKASISDASSSPVMCTLPRWLLAFLFIIAVLTVGNFIILLLLWLKRKSE